MRLPDPIRTEVEAHLEGHLGERHTIDTAAPLGGGCINPSARVVTDRGGDFFLKWNTNVPPDTFALEADGLRKLGEAGPLRIPEVVGHAPRWLLLEFVERSAASPDTQATLGQGLAELHHRTRGAHHGGSIDNYIGPLPQQNRPDATWSAFWWNRRVEPLLEQAFSAGYLSGLRGSVDALRDRMSALLDPVSDEDGCSLLHGDLWSGNTFPDREGSPVLVDPAVYRGHREVDLAMTELFGGFAATFYDAYAERWPLQDGYREVRRDIYQLYPLLVHVRLFGASYEAGVRVAAKRILAY